MTDMLVGPPASADERSVTAASATASTWDDVVVAYYDTCLRDYQRGWTDRHSLAMHMGYWDERTRSHAQSLVNMNRQIAQRALLGPRVRVLDAGCGIGGTSLWIAQSFGAQVIGITLAQDQVERATRYATDRGLGDTVAFLRRDFHDTGFDDASFDVVWAQESVCHSLDKPRFFHEAFRVLRPGGRLVMEEGLRYRRPYDPADEDLLSAWLHGWAVQDLATAAEYERWAGDAGFDQVHIDDVREHTVPSLRRLYRRSSLVYALGLFRHPIRRAREALRRERTRVGDSTPWDRDRRLRNWRGGRYQWKALERGLWYIGILSALKPRDTKGVHAHHG